MGSRTLTGTWEEWGPPELDTGVLMIVNQLGRVGGPQTIPEAVSWVSGDANVTLWRHSPEAAVEVVGKTTLPGLSAVNNSN